MQVEAGFIIWDDKEPTPDPDEALKEALEELKGKVGTLLEQQGKMMEMLTKALKDKPETEGSKASKKKLVKAKKE